VKRERREKEEERRKRTRFSQKISLQRRERKKKKLNNAPLGRDHGAQGRRCGFRPRRRGHGGRPAAVPRVEFGKRGAGAVLRVSGIEEERIEERKKTESSMS
jgi:hypothetical protein